MLKIATQDLFFSVDYKSIDYYKVIPKKKYLNFKRDIFTVENLYGRVLTYKNIRFKRRGVRRSLSKDSLSYNLWISFRPYPDGWEKWAFYKPRQPDIEYYSRYKPKTTHNFKKHFSSPEKCFLKLYNIDNEYRWPLPKRNFFSAPILLWYSKPDFIKMVWKTIKLS